MRKTLLLIGVDHKNIDLGQFMDVIGRNVLNYTNYNVVRQPMDVAKISFIVRYRPELIVIVGELNQQTQWALSPYIYINVADDFKHILNLISTEQRVAVVGFRAYDHPAFFRAPLAVMEIIKKMLAWAIQPR
jgi:hypothetical protein